MKTRALCAATLALAVGVAGAQIAQAEPDADQLVIDGQKFVTEVKAGKDNPLDTLYSGWRYRNDTTQALQKDDFENPAFIFVDQARDAWDKVEGTAGKACSSCHGDVEESMKGVRAGMPKWNAKAGEVWSLENYVNNCRTTRMKAEPLKWDKPDMNAMVALIALQSRGMPVDVDISGPAEAWFKRGEKMYYTRYGQLELSCASCHEENNGRMIRADHLSQGHINGFPTYRLKNTKLNSIHGRFKGCIRDTRAHTFKPGSAEFRALELYVTWRGEGLSVESPSVRQ